MLCAFLVNGIVFGIINTFGILFVKLKCKSGAIMAAPYRNLECYDHRVLISEVCPNNVNQVKVFYLDYGTVRKIPISSVRVLHEKFTELPAQALEAKLWDLADPSGGNKWSKESTRRFYW